MAAHPETRASLILRLGNAGDDAAWQEFLEIYEPMLLRLALRWGVQRSDAAEVVQETLVAVAGAIANYETREHSGAFRGWLAAIVRNKLVDHLAAASRQPQGSGDTNVQRWLEQQADDTGPDSVWDWEHRRGVFAWAAARVQQQVEEKTWQAFYRTNVLGEPVQQTARELGMREGMVYVARSRVMARLRRTVDTWSASTNEETAE